MIGIIDYKAGNIQSVKNAFQRIGADVSVVNSAEGLKKCDATVLPGVGSFSCIKELEGIKEELLQQIRNGKPFLGICLGMQWLFEESEESPGCRGLGIFKGKVVRFPKNVRTPQMGWNRINATKESLLIGNLDDKFFYFLHSFYVVPEEDVELTITEYNGIGFTSAVGRENIFATQFHPEKSGEQGLEMLKNFLEAVK